MTKSSTKMGSTHLAEIDFEPLNASTTWMGSYLFCALNNIKALVREARWTELDNIDSDDDYKFSPFLFKI